MHASVINIFQKNPGNIDYNLIEEYLTKAETSPFALGVNKKSTEKISKEDSATGKLCSLQFRAWISYLRLFHFLIMAFTFFTFYHP